MSEEVNVKGDYSDQRSPGESVRRADGEEVTVSASVLLRAALFALSLVTRARVGCRLTEAHAKELTNAEYRSYLTLLTRNNPDDAAHCPPPGRCHPPAEDI